MIINSRIKKNIDNTVKMFERLKTMLVLYFSNDRQKQ